MAHPVHAHEAEGERRARGGCRARLRAGSRARPLRHPGQPPQVRGGLGNHAIGVRDDRDDAQTPVKDRAQRPLKPGHLARPVRHDLGRSRREEPHDPAGRHPAQPRVGQVRGQPPETRPQPHQPAHRHPGARQQQPVQPAQRVAHHVDGPVGRSRGQPPRHRKKFVLRRAQRRSAAPAVRGRADGALRDVGKRGKQRAEVPRRADRTVQHQKRAHAGGPRDGRPGQVGHAPAGGHQPQQGIQRGRPSESVSRAARSFSAASSILAGSVLSAGMAAERS